MKEDLLHYIWKYKLFYKSEIVTTSNELVHIISSGSQNYNTGPDFFNAKIQIGDQLWAGNVEIHIDASDWYTHHHEIDVNYDNVILHVVWNHDSEVFNKDDSEIPTLELKNYVSKDLLDSYNKLFSKSKKWIYCENDILSVDSFVLDNWLERLLFERLEDKSDFVKELLEKTKYDWEDVFFRILAKNFGLKLNGDSFFEMANSLKFATVRKVRQNQKSLESLFFGQLGMLSVDLDTVYFNELQKEYAYLCKKFRIEEAPILKVQFFRLRPANFPTIRISQFANLLSCRENLFSDLMSFSSVKEFYDFFDIGTSEFWNTHYTFNKESKKRTKKLSNSFIELIVINTILPVKFMYLQYLGKTDFTEVLTLIKDIESEKNSIIDKFRGLGIYSNNAFESQALVELKNNYCAKQKCLNCAIGKSLITI
jgi:hypothetical protein